MTTSAQSTFDRSASQMGDLIIGLPFEPTTVATVLRPELAGLRAQAADQVSTSGVQPQGAERFFLAEEDAMFNRELTKMAYQPRCRRKRVKPGRIWS